MMVNDSIVFYILLSVDNVNRYHVLILFLSAFVQLLGSHGLLAKRAPGKAFLAETIQASA